MTVKHNISLKSYNTFGIDVNAKHFVSVNSIHDLQKILNIKQYSDLFILSGGSNILLTQHVEALVIYNNIKGRTIVSENDTSVIIKVNSGENWHDFVLWTLKNNFGGLENLSLIPGKVGTAPIQNIGAYGIELKDCFISCEAVNLKTNTTRTFTKTECNFGYRQSVFKSELKGQYCITSVTFKLSKHLHALHTNYGAINDELNALNIKTPTIQDVSQAVINIRQRKLPDPKVIGNSGSFFKNPIVNYKTFAKLEQNFKNIPHYKLTQNQIKIPAGWLIETAGFKGKRFDNYGVHDKQALVLVNYNNAEGQAILNLAKLIQHTVLRIFNIEIETEVNII